MDEHRHRKRFTPEDIDELEEEFWKSLYIAVGKAAIRGLVLLSWAVVGAAFTWLVTDGHLLPFVKWCCS